MKPPSCTQAYRVTATVLASLLLLMPAPGVAQSLGDIARQERERREKLKQHTARVLTNEDLAKPQILDPLDRVRLAAAPGQPEPLPPDLALEMTVAEPVSAESLGIGLPSNVSLGDIARYYRLKKLLGEEALASRVRQTNAIPVAQQSAIAPAIETAPMTVAVGEPAVDQIPAGPGTPAGVVMGDVARSYRNQGSVRAVREGVVQDAGRAPEISGQSLQAASPPGNIGVAPVSAMAAPSLPAASPAVGGASARLIAPSVSAGPGSPPEVSLGDVARQLRQEQAKTWMSHPEGSAAAPALPEEAAQPIAATMPDARASSALTVFSAPPPAPNHRSLRVVELSEADVLAATTLVEVKRGDSLWRIAARHLGNGTRWKELHARNPEIRNPNLIRVGDVIRVPQEALAERRREFNGLLVRAGDTLWGLAALEFGRGDAWNCIARANPQLRNPNIILPGQELNRPEECSEAL
ncbi:MAG: LysM peptidoglycan-binding domain-containing protein [Candidatus Acidiferrales bacterium]